jgi:hypothetical protein
MLEKYCGDIGKIVKCRQQLGRSGASLPDCARDFNLAAAQRQPWPDQDFDLLIGASSVKVTATLTIRSY